MRKQERALADARAMELLRTGEYGYLSLGTGVNGYAYGIPISFAYDSNENALYFHCATEGQKLEHLRRNAHVSFCVVGKTEVLPEKFSTKYESAIAFGRVEIASTDDEKRRALRLLVEKYSPQYTVPGEAYMEKSLERVVAFKIVVEHISGKGRI